MSIHVCRRSLFTLQGTHNSDHAAHFHTYCNPYRIFLLRRLELSEEFLCILSATLEPVAQNPTTFTLALLRFGSRHHSQCGDHGPQILDRGSCPNRYPRYLMRRCSSRTVLARECQGPNHREFPGDVKGSNGVQQRRWGKEIFPVLRWLITEEIFSGDRTHHDASRAFRIAVAGGGRKWPCDSPVYESSSVDFDPFSVRVRVSATSGSTLAA
mmetsp:Transcript_1140/g.2902  ORF Transcript_1140/g.2902 Transcript_1140/m.2902 type:complete len:212 (+) Transcript_1140:333-968(+)